MVIDILARALRQKEGEKVRKKKGIQIGKEAKLSSFAGDMIYGDYPKESTKKLLKLL